MMNMQPHDDFGDVFTFEEFKACVDCGAFISDDGSGYYATELEHSDISVWSDAPVPEWATHVAWYNK